MKNYTVVMFLILVAMMNPAQHAFAIKDGVSGAQLLDKTGKTYSLKSNTSGTNTAKIEVPETLSSRDEAQLEAMKWFSDEENGAFQEELAREDIISEDDL